MLFFQLDALLVIALTLLSTRVDALTIRSQWTDTLQSKMKQVSDIVMNNPVINQVQSQLWSQAANSGIPIVPEEQLREMLEQRGGTYEDFVKILYELQGLAYPNLVRQDNQKLSARVVDYRKSLMTFLNNVTLVEQTKAERSILPLFSLFSGPSLISQEVILPSVYKALDNGGSIIPSWYPNLPADKEHFPSNTEGGWVDNPSQAPINPTIDPFYNPPFSAFNGKPHGQPITYRRFGVSREFVNVNRAFQYTFTSQDNKGQFLWGAAAVLIPNNANEKLSAVQYLPFIDAMGPTCIPTYQLATGYIDPNVNYFLSTNRITGIVDHGGPNRYFGIGQVEGRITLDAMISLDQLAPSMGISYQGYFMHGYSGGTVPAGWAVELRRTYAPQVDIRAVALGGVIANMEKVALAIDGTTLSGFVPAVLNSYMKQYPDLAAIVENQEIKNPAYLKRIKATDGYCFFSTVFNTVTVNNFKSFFKSGTKILDIPIIRDIFAENSLGQQPPIPDIPILMFNSIQDEVASIDQVDSLVDTWCKQGALIDYFRFENMGHLQTIAINDAQIIEFYEKITNLGYKPAPCKSWQDATKQSQPSFDFGKASIDDIMKVVYGNVTETPL